MPSDKTNPILRTTDPVAELRWDSLLELQVAAYFPYELSFYAGWPEWLHATNVLDTGCGNGYFLSKLRSFFPEKHYTGLDFSEELITAARQNTDLKNIDLFHGDFFTFASPRPFDVVIMRLILQHMSSLDLIFQQLGKLLKIGGSVVIVEPDTASFLNYPRTPVFEKLLATYAEATARGKFNRASLPNLASDLDGFGGWALRQDKTYIAPVIGPFGNTPVMQMFFLWIDLFEQTPGLDFPFDDARNELNKWGQIETAFSQVGVRIVQVERTQT